MEIIRKGRSCYISVSNLTPKKYLN